MVVSQHHGWPCLVAAFTPAPCLTICPGLRCLKLHSSGFFSLTSRLDTDSALGHGKDSAHNQKCLPPRSCISSLRILLPSHPCQHPESCKQALAAMVIAPAITMTVTAVDLARMMAAAAATKCPAPPTAMGPRPQPQCNCLHYILLGPVQVQTLEEPEPDPKSGSRFEEIYP